MADAVAQYYELRLERARQALEKNNFDARLAPDTDAARALVLDEIVGPMGAARVGLGGSVSLVKSGIYHGLKDLESLELLDTFDPALPPEEKMELRRQSLLADVFLTGANAVTEDGCLVNLDMIGNRVGALLFGPKKVVVVAGRNKLVPDVAAGMERIKEYAACVNAIKLKKKTPCAKTGVCHDCASEDRICNVWTISEKSFPAGRVTVVLVNEDLGF